MSRTHHKHRNPYAIMRAQRKGERKELRDAYAPHPKLKPVNRTKLRTELRAVLTGRDL